MDLDKIVLEDDNGEEIEFDVILQIEIENENKLYYVIADPEDDYIDVCYTLTDEDDDTFYFVDDPEELDMVQEVWNTLTTEELA